MLITTVTGSIPASELGRTDCHGHLFVRGGLPVALEPDFLLDDVDAAVAEVEEARAAGAGAVVDCMPIGVGRDVDGLVQVASRTGLVVIGATGFHKDAFYPLDHWARTASVDTIADLVVAEHIAGMDRAGYSAPWVDRSRARAGIIKVATTGGVPTPFEATVLRAVGFAAVATGLPVITHTESFSAAMHQLDALEAVGLPPDRVVLSHMDRHCDVAQLTEACATGATVCLDWLGRTDRRPDEVVADLVARVIAAGYGDHVVLGQDLARRQYWRAYGGGPGLVHLFSTVTKLLAAAGVADDQIETILAGTPARVLQTVGQ